MPKGPGEGILAIEQPWPSMMRTLRGDHERFEKTYFSTFNGKYFTGDGARIDEDGYIWITGRVDVSNFLNIYLNKNIPRFHDDHQFQRSG